MRAVTFKNNKLEFQKKYPEPISKKEYSKVKILKAGICNTDIEITKGYMNFSGILGHEFIGIVEESENSALLGEKVVGEINFGCRNCEYCRAGLQRHCPKRSTLGILNADGCMADYCSIPTANLLLVPEYIADYKAVFIEPLAAACEILEQLEHSGNEKVVVLGDGKLGILCAWVLSIAFTNVILVGHNDNKLELAKWNGIKTVKMPSSLDLSSNIVVEATGSASGIVEAISLCKPRGKIIMKSTVAKNETFNFASIVINEISLIGSRCGQFKDAITILQEYPDIPLQRLISMEYPVEEAIKAFEKAKEKNVLKVILNF